MRLSPRHPRYRSLRVRERLAAAARSGVVVPEGLVAHGRGEAFDYLLGERTSASARRAERRAAEWLLAAERPVVSVNGNVAALAADGVARLAAAVPGLAVEVNLFHRTPGRARAIAARLRAAGIDPVLGVRPTATIPGLPSDRARVDRRGILVADVCLVPLEDGDRTAALRAMGKRVIAIDLNPLSRTSRTADLPVVDELSRALAHLAEDARRIRRSRRPVSFRPAEAPQLLADALAAIDRHLSRAAAVRAPRRARRAPASPRSTRGTRGRSRRTP
ncbi:MAG TPA: phosphopantothenate/pantothenate synthetase [Thermoplasmata archaeon]|nr:phosphopantothenate/pantothenate synthetase [Thermoplasmata archaeon]